MSTIFEYVGSMIVNVVIALPVLLLYRLIWNKLKKRRSNYLHEAGVILFFSFLIGLFGLTFDQDASDEQTAMNLQLFQVFEDTIRAIINTSSWEPFVINLLGNIVMFSPIGFLIPLLWRTFQAKRTIITAFLISLFIETVQLTLDRSSDVDDLWLNTLGGFMGYGIYKNVPKRISERFK